MPGEPHDEAAEQPVTGPAIEHGHAVETFTVAITEVADSEEDTK